MATVIRPFQWLGGLFALDSRMTQDRNAILMAQDPPCALVGRVATAQVINTGAFTDINHDTEFADNDNMFVLGNPSRVTIQRDGWYWCATGAKWASQAGGVRVCAISLNGAIVDELSNEIDATAIAGNFRHGASGGLVLVAGDIVRVNVFQNGAATLNCNARLSVFRASGPGS